MVAELRIHFEGDESLRRGFRKFLDEILKRAQAKRISFKLVATGGKPAHFYRKALKKHSQALNVLLLDSEEPFSEQTAARRGVSDLPPDRVFWMAPVMEVWFLADADRLMEYYGQRFRQTALPRNRNVEQILKADVLSSLKRATQDTTAGAYDKTAHAPSLLGLIRADQVRIAAPNCDRLFTELLAKLSAE